MLFVRPRTLAMKVSTRHIVWAPLLIVAIAISYGLVESLRNEPCPSERVMWLVGNLIAVVYALYFFAGYWVIVTRRYVEMTILSGWAWHLLLLTPFLATACSESKSLDQLRQVLGVGLAELVIAIVLVALASSWAVFLRYRVSNRLPMEGRRRFLRLLIAGATAASIVLSAAALFATPLLRDAYGPDLPMPTLVLFDAYRYLAVLPVPFIASLIFVAVRNLYDERQMNIALNGAVALIIFFNLLFSAFVFSALAPVKTMCRCG